MAITFNIGLEFGYVLLSISLLSLAVITIGFIFANGARMKVFTQ